MRGQEVILLNFPISHFLKSLAHSALASDYQMRLFGGYDSSSPLKKYHLRRKVASIGWDFKTSKMVKAIEVAIGWLLSLAWKGFFCDSWGEHQIGNEKFNILNWFLQKHWQAMMLQERSFKLKEQAACVFDNCTCLHICELGSWSTKQCWSLLSGAVV